MRKLLLTTLLVGAVTLAVPGSLSTAAARSGESGAFVGSINAVRAANGLGGLGVSGQLASAAQSWAQHMADIGGIAHNPNLGSSVSANWVRLGENVGVGYDVGGLMDAFVASSSHYRNIVQADFNYVGVGSVWGGDGRLYTTHLFMTLAAAPAPPEPEPAPAPPQPDPAPVDPA
ncbi:MAG: CAP domain-containing protein, partial [Acidimicrobiales bacterium]